MAGPPGPAAKCGASLNGARITLTAEMARGLWSYDPETGELRWRVRGANRIEPGTIAGNVSSTGYVHIGFAYKLWKAHRIAWLITHGVWPSGQIDHVNGCKSDNRLANLRDVSMSQNQANVGRKRHNTSGYKGVSWSAAKGRWQAYIQCDGVQQHLGYFDNPRAAHSAYVAAARLAFGNHARAA